MNLLAIDTACGLASAALIKGDALLGAKHSTQISKQAEELMPLIDSLLATHALSYAALNHMAVSIGPGSFTGVRIGLAAAQGIALARNIPLCGITTLEATALRFVRGQKPSQRFLVALNAQRGQAFVQAFDINNEWPKAAGDAALVALEEVTSHAKSNNASIITGTCEGLLTPLKGQTITGAVEYSAEEIVALAGRAIAQKRTIAAVPFYIREPDAKLPKARA
jgi:tRNA threonylcarbamoyl adenosine modification protein YeaZ